MSLPYRGRFAPSPTGHLHFGSLVAALASYLDARAAGGEWLVRMEDLDTPRTVPGADIDILRTLERFCLEWDGAVSYQSRRIDLYRAALEQLKAGGHAYPCSCPRREVVGVVYPGTCRNGVANPKRPQAWRVRADSIDTGDFVVLRADGVFAYQLAVVVDDADQGITNVVRGSDLLDSTPRQIFLQQLLGFAQPGYLHIPVVTNAAGEKLSKQTLAPALNTSETATELKSALRFLGQPEPGADSPAEILQLAIANWNSAAIPRRLTARRG
jgi:glutamyl-Q tRNA(Asp) synthetase